MEVTNRFKGLDLVECLKKYGGRFRAFYRRQWSKPSRRKRNIKRQNACLRWPCKWLRKEVKGKWEKERYTHLNAEFQRVARRDKKAFLREQCKEIEENNRMGKTRDLFKRYQGNISYKDGHNKEQKRFGPNRNPLTTRKPRGVHCFKLWRCVTIF